MILTWKTVESEEEWEQFLLTYAPQSLFQSWRWGEVQKRIGVPIRRYGAFRGGKLAAIMQIAVVRARRGSFVHVRHGPVIPSLTASVWDDAVKKLREIASIERCWFIRISPLLAPGPGEQTLFARYHTKPAAIHRMDGEYCWVLDLSLSEEDLLSGMRKTTRYEIRKAEKDGVVITRSSDLRNIAQFLTLYRTTSSRHGFVPHIGIREEFDVFGKAGDTVLYTGAVGGETTAAAVIVYYGNQAIYHHGASKQSKSPVSTAIQWAAIRDAKKRGMNVYNFWGIAPENSPNHPWRGITLFKKGFGGREIAYIHAQDIPVSPLYYLSRAVETVRRMRRGYD